MNNEAIIILAGAIQKKEGGSFRTSNLDEGDGFGVTGDRLRVLAGAYLFEDLSKSDKNVLVIASGGKGKCSGNMSMPDLSFILKKELISLGVPSKNIIEENGSNSTYQQLQELSKITKERNLSRIYIVSNDYQLPRINALLHYMLEVDLKGKTEALSAEKILIEKNPGAWEDIINKAYESDRMKKRISLEAEGVNQIKNGTYKFK